VAALRARQSRVPEMPIDLEIPKTRAEAERPRAGSHFDSRRRAEFEGFLLSTAGVLILLSLVSYHSIDPSLDTSVSNWSAIHNWIGRLGAYVADALLQGLGWTAYLVPLVLLVAGVRRIVLRPFAAPRTKAVGVVLLAASVAALLDMIPVTPPIAGMVRGGGVAGYLLGAALVSGLNPIGAAIVAGAVLLASLFLVTRFSFATLGRFFRAQFAPLAGVRDTWRAWQESRERQRLKKKLEEERKTGKPPIGLDRAAPAGERLAPKPATVAEPQIQRRA
jgi:DNA segregation ATPase FtsK/SpoIIIE, S-DNA-T family